MFKIHMFQTPLCYFRVFFQSFVFTLYSYLFPLFPIIHVFSIPLFQTDLYIRWRGYQLLEKADRHMHHRMIYNLVCLHQIIWWHSAIILFQWLEANISEYSRPYDTPGIMKSPPIIRHNTKTWPTYHEVKFSPRDDPLRSHEVSSGSYAAHQYSGQLVTESSWSLFIRQSIGSHKVPPRSYGARKWVGHLAKVKDQVLPDHTLWPLKNGDKSPYPAA